MRLSVRVASGGTEPILYLPLHLARRLRLRQREAPVQLGLRCERLALRVVRRGGTGVALSAKAAEMLGLPASQPLWFRLQRGTLHLGPVVGILVQVNPASRRLFGAQSDFFRALCRRGRHAGELVYVFSPDDVDWTRRMVHGFVWSERAPGGGGAWVRVEVPLPHVVYDRVQSRRADRDAAMRLTKQRLVQEFGVQLFPDGFLDKWRMHEMLAQKRLLAPYLPATARLSGAGTLRNYLGQYRTLYLKPAHGSLGAGIYVAERTQRGYALRYQRRGRLRVQRAARIDGLWERFRQTARNTPYVAQQGLNLASAAGCRFDVRLLMQKDEYNVWRQTKMFARLARPGRITSNITTGAEGVSVTSVLRPILGEKTTACVRRLKAVAVLVARTTEEALGQPLGELGVDLGVDRDGRVWLIEVNSKPFRKVTEGTPRIVRRSIDRPLGYARYLAGFTRRTRRIIPTQAC